MGRERKGGEIYIYNGGKGKGGGGGNEGKGVGFDDVEKKGKPPNFKDTYN